jgi:hypothetical protein
MYQSNLEQIMDILEARLMLVLIYEEPEIRSSELEGILGISSHDVEEIGQTLVQNGLALVAGPNAHWSATSLGEQLVNHLFNQATSDCD